MKLQIMRLLYATMTMANCHKVIINRSLDSTQATESADRDKVKLLVSSRFYFCEVARSADGAHFYHLFC